MTRLSLDTLPMPGSMTAASALEVATAYHSPALLNHSLRAYVWAAARGVADDIPFDAELLYVAALFHDIGLVPAFDSHTVAFEEAGGHVAQIFAAGAGWSVKRRARLSEVIVRHMWPRVEVSTDPEGHLLARATATEVVGKEAERYSSRLPVRGAGTLPQAGSSRAVSDVLPDPGRSQARQFRGRRGAIGTRRQNGGQPARVDRLT